MPIGVLQRSVLGPLLFLLYINDQLKLNGKRPYQPSSVKYLGIKIDQYLNWQDHINNIAIKLNKANALLYKVRQFVNQRTLISIYYAVFDSHLTYASIVWGQTRSSINRVFIIQKKALRTIHFKGKLDHTSSLFSASNIIKLPDKISIENCLFASKSLNKQLPEIFNNCFFSDTYRYETSCSEKGMLKVKSFNTKSHGKEAIIYSAINTLNSLQKQLKHFLLPNLTTFQLKFRLSPSKKNFVICFIKSPLKMMKNAFYFISKALFILKIFKFLS